MNEAKVRALKREIQAAAVEAARKFRELGRDQTGLPCCGQCPQCQESLSNLSQLFFNAMSRELLSLTNAGDLELQQKMRARFRALSDDEFIPDERLN